jgi:UDP-N-acetylglucosamine transferase subunit ALG13
MDSPAPRLFVTVGTDHHSFDRLIEWVDAWLAYNRHRSVRCVVQVGTGTPPSHADWSRYLTNDETQRALRDATAVVSHGGPATIMACRSLGLIPIVVPRRSRFGEHVDDHQVAFARKMAEQREVKLAEQRQDLWHLLDRALEDPVAFRSPVRPAPVQAAVRRFEQVVNTMMEASSDSPHTATPVAYIGGAGRSGSTLLERILGQIEGLCAVGEVVNLWERGVLRNQLCGCGAAFRACDFWREVGHQAFGGWEAVDVRMVLELDRAVNRHRFLPLMLGPFPSPSHRRQARAYGEIQRRLYYSIQHVSGCRIVIDSSKEAAYAFLLQETEGIDLRLLHLVRDSRGVAHSWTRRIPRPEVTERPAFMPTYRPARAAAEWVLDNMLFHALARRVSRHFLRYEDFVARPRRETEKVLTFLGESFCEETLGFIGSGGVLLDRTHSVSGNPMRFIHGSVQLNPDEEWRRVMDARHRAVVSTLTWPLLHRYGYGKPHA